MPIWQAIIFDLDDTLYLERDFVLSGFRAVAEWAGPRLGIQPEQGLAELTAMFKNCVRGDTFNRWLATHGAMEKDLVQHLIEVYRSHQPRITPCPEVPTVINALQGRYRLGLLSDGQVEVQRRKLGALGLVDFFQAVVISGQWGSSYFKPSIEPYNEVLGLLGVASQRAVYLADNPTKDFLGARRAGMASIRVRRAGGLYRHLEPLGAEYAPDKEISDLTTLEPALTDLAASWA